MTIPKIYGADIKLRPYEESDLAEIFALRSSPNASAYVNGMPFDRKTTWDRMARNVGLWQLTGLGYWVIACSRTNIALGEIGFTRLIRDKNHEPEAVPEMVGFCLPSIKERALPQRRRSWRFSGLMPREEPIFNAASIRRIWPPSG